MFKPLIFITGVAMLAACQTDPQSPQVEDSTEISKAKVDSAFEKLYQFIDSKTPQSKMPIPDSTIYKLP